jgi:hypothetical protein
VNYAALRYVLQGDFPWREQRGQGKAAWSVAVVIAYHADKESGLCFAAVRTLGHEARCARSTVEGVLLDMLDAKVLELVIEGSGRRAHCYRIIGHLDSSVPITGTEHAGVVVSRSEPRSVPISDAWAAVVSRSGRPPIGGRELQGRVEGARGSGSAADAAVAARSGDADADHAAYLAAIGDSEGSA